MAVETNRWGIIYNPKAGSRKTQKKWNEIREYMESRGVLFDYLQSEGYGSVEVRKDYAGLDRMVFAVWPGDNKEK